MLFLERHLVDRSNSLTAPELPYRGYWKQMAIPPKRILLATIGSLGDLHPCLALALGLRERGHQPVIASTELYRAKVGGTRL